MNNDNDIEKIIKVFEKSNVSKMELEVDNIKIKLEKESVMVEKIQVNSSSNITSKIGDTVKSPVVGTYYAQKSNDKPPFVTIGSLVKKGDVLCIIEAMKVMNEITAPFDGKILEIYCVNEALVEYDKDLFLIGE